MALIVYHASPSGKTQTHSLTKAYNVAKLHWAEPAPGHAVSVTDGSGVLIASLSSKAPTTTFNPPKSVTGLQVTGALSGFIHVYTQDPAGFGG